MDTAFQPAEDRPVDLRIIKWADPIPEERPDAWGKTIIAWTKKCKLDEENDGEKMSKVFHAKPKQIEAKGQIGLSYRLQINALGSENLFLKQPPIPSPADLLRFGSSKSYYASMKKRLVAEFEKNFILSHIRRRCAGGIFSIPQPIALCQTNQNGDDVSIPGLIYEFVDGNDLTKETFFTLSNPDSFFDFAIPLAESVRIVHNHGILHSFIVPRNIIFSKTTHKTNYNLVGFGYATLSDSKPDVAKVESEIEDACYRAPECLASDNLGALWFPADIYSLGALFYRYIVGKAPRDLPKDVSKLKLHVYEAMKNVDISPEERSNLFFLNENIVKIVDKCLRHNPNDRFSCAEELLEALAIAKSAGRKGSKNDLRRKQIKSRPREQLVQMFINVAVQSSREQKGVNPLLRSVIESRAEHLFEDAKRIGRGHHEIYGHRDLLVTSLCRLIAAASEGQVYRTMTYPGYWTDQNLGSNGRFLTMNKHMARNGLHIQRLFLVTTKFHQLIETEQQILEAQYDAQCDVEKDPDAPKGFEIKVKVLSEPEQDALLRFEVDATQVAYLGPNSMDQYLNECLCLNFISQGKLTWNNGRQVLDRVIKKVRYWQPTGTREKAFRNSLNTFWKYWNSGSQSLKDYIEPKNRAKCLSQILNGPKEMSI